MGNSRGPRHNGWVQAYRMLVPGHEAQATRDVRLTGVNWNTPCAAINGTDALATMESTVQVKQNETGTWKSWTLTNAVQYWLADPNTNYGVILWTPDEDLDGYDMRFRSSEHTNKPKLEVVWSNQPKTVYFLKDHLGSVRATVDQTGAVVGYDDYDPWGYILEGRTQPTPWSATQGVAENKFTGKERDEEFGLNWDFFGARYYDAEIGRWMVVDPLAAEHSEESPFVYTGGNPINRIDPNGMDWFRNQNTGEVEWFETSAEGFSDLERNSWMNAGTAAAYFNGSQLTAVQQTGNIFDGFTFNKVQVEAVSGRPTQSGEFDYSVERQTLIDVGPLPEGVYYMNTSAIQYWRDLGIVDKIAALLGLGTWPGGTMAWGESRVWLQPSSIRIVDPRTGKDVVRGGFSIHGGITPGSAGCIDCFSNAPQFFKFIERLQPLNMPVIVKYNNR